MVTRPGFFLTPRQDSEDQDCQLLITSVTQGGWTTTALIL